MVVTVPEVPSRCSAVDAAAVLGGEAVDVAPRPRRSSPRTSRGVTVTPPWRSASVTTPIGSEIQAADLRVRRAVLRRHAAAEPHQFGRAAADVEQDDARRRADRPAACSRWRRAAPRSRGRRSRDRCRPARARDRGNSRPFAAERQASVAISRARVTPRLRILLAADAQRLDRAHDRGLAQPARAGDALAQPDDARERVDDAEAVAGRRAPPAAGNCWCRDRARHRSGRTRPGPPAPSWRGCRYGDRRPRRGRRGTRSRSGVEAGRPGLVVHQKPFPAPKPCSARLDGAAVNLNFEGKV